jgi:hypothetical protein
VPIGKVDTDRNLLPSLLVAASSSVFRQKNIAGIPEDPELLKQKLVLTQPSSLGEVLAPFRIFIPIIA